MNVTDFLKGLPVGTLVPSAGQGDLDYVMPRAQVFTKAAYPALFAKIKQLGMGSGDANTPDWTSSLPANGISTVIDGGARFFSAFGTIFAAGVQNVSSFTAPRVYKCASWGAAWSSVFSASFSGNRSKRSTSSTGWSAEDYLSLPIIEAAFGALAISHGDPSNGASIMTFDAASGAVHEGVAVHMGVCPRGASDGTRMGFVSATLNQVVHRLNSLGVSNAGWTVATVASASGVNLAAGFAGGLLKHPTSGLIAACASDGSGFVTGMTVNGLTAMAASAGKLAARGVTTVFDTEISTEGTYYVLTNVGIFFSDDLINWELGVDTNAGKLDAGQSISSASGTHVLMQGPDGMVWFRFTPQSTAGASGFLYRGLVGYFYGKSTAGRRPYTTVGTQGRPIWSGGFFYEGRSTTPENAPRHAPPYDVSTSFRLPDYRNINAHSFEAYNNTTLDNSGLQGPNLLMKVR